MKKDLKEMLRRFRELGSHAAEEESKKYLDFLSEYYRNQQVSMEVEPESIPLKVIVEKRNKGIPFEYIFQITNFMGRNFYCDTSTLIPTPETKAIVEKALEIIKEKQRENGTIRVIEIGTGCGNIAITISIGSTNTLVYASDISGDAIEVAKRNANLYGRKDSISLLTGDMFEPFKNMDLEGKVDIVICNPPYIPTRFIDNLPSEIIENEPRIALDGGPFGIDIILKLIEVSQEFLENDGFLIFEIGVGMDRIVDRLFKKDGGYGEINYIELDNEVKGIIARRLKNLL